MSNNPNTKDGYPDDPSWEILFEMAGDYEGQYEDQYENQYEDQYAGAGPETMQDYDPANFYEDSSQQETQYHTPEEALKVLFGYDSFRPGQKSVRGRKVRLLPDPGCPASWHYARCFTTDLADAGSGEGIEPGRRFCGIHQQCTVGESFF